MLILPKDIYEVYREYSDDPSEGKRRPNLVIYVDDDDVYCLPITGTSPNKPPRHKDDYWKLEIEGWKDSQLTKKSWLLVNQAKIINREDIEKTHYIGPLQDEDWERLLLKNEEYENYLIELSKNRRVRSNKRNRKQQVD
ncbi:type II toxin-antitoxin system PemK/MazF family toxin [Paenibacillus sp. O199]|uniref:type II toxin-antitoxin system PemK/MazF family toxin n=1 Tax=Paenibacillus sp. O199 TaxID=1643925 RepID=UPI0007BF60A9|nr:type II toxin-antitoxin system PemK/MazF family toxin [Paenibacillus sp. O199]